MRPQQLTPKGKSKKDFFTPCEVEQASQLSNPPYVQQNKSLN